MSKHSNVCCPASVAHCWRQYTDTRAAAKHRVRTQTMSGGGPVAIREHGCERQGQCSVGGKSGEGLCPGDDHRSDVRQEDTILCYSYRPMRNMRLRNVRSEEHTSELQ